MSTIKSVWDNKGIVARVKVAVVGIRFIYGPSPGNIPGFECFSREHDFARARAEDDDRQHPDYFLIQDLPRKWILHQIKEEGANGVLLGSHTIDVPKP